MASEYSLFKGYEKKSRRYATKRKEELRLKKQNEAIVLKLIKEKLEEPDIFTDEEYEALEKRYASLTNKTPIKNTKNTEQNFIPFETDEKTIIYVREKHCFKSKWVEKFGVERITKTIEAYKKVLHLKPSGVVYWNPVLKF